MMILTKVYNNVFCRIHDFRAKLVDLKLSYLKGEISLKSYESLVIELGRAIVSFVDYTYAVYELGGDSLTKQLKNEIE